MDSDTIEIAEARRVTARPGDLVLLRIDPGDLPEKEDEADAALATLAESLRGKLPRRVEVLVVLSAVPLDVAVVRPEPT